MSSFFEERAERDPATGCWNWSAYVAITGYGKYGRPGDPNTLAHRGSWVEANGPIPKGMLVCHKCDNRRCVNPKHLFLGTHADNSADAVAKGRQARGSRSGPAKLKEADVSIIKWCLEAGVKGAKLATLYGVTGAAIYSIADGSNWRHVKALQFNKEAA